MTPIILRNTAVNGDLLEATFLPEKGMNLMSCKKNTLEAIDRSTRTRFEERSSGLGCPIGPHFHLKRQQTIIPPKDLERFPHIAKLGDEAKIDSFPHGVGRYAAWQAISDATKVRATLSGKDLLNGVPLSVLEGQNFKMSYDAELTPEGLQIKMSVVSHTTSVVGHLPQGKGKVISEVHNAYIGLDYKEVKPIPKGWNFNSQHVLIFDLDNEADCTFFPFLNPTEGKIAIDAITRKLVTIYRSLSQENSWQLYHPRGASFVCVDPVSCSQDPRHPNLSVSALNINLQILDNTDV